MPDIHGQPDDGLGPDPLDRGSGKVMGGGGGGYIDPSYEDALRIMGRANEIPSPWSQRALIMDDAKGAELARHLTALRHAAGAGFRLLGRPGTPGPVQGETLVAEAVEDFVAALQASPPDTKRLAALRTQIAAAPGEAGAALQKVCQYPAVQARLAGSDPAGAPGG